VADPIGPLDPIESAPEQDQGGGFLDSLAGGIGRAFSPVKPAADFLLPETQYGGGFDFGSLMGSIGFGAKSLVTEGIPGLAAGAASVFNPDAPLTLRQRFLYGGLTVGAAGLLGREAYQSWRTRPVNPVSFDMSPGFGTDVRMLAKKSGYDRSLELGSPPRFVEELTPEGDEFLRRFPGTRPQQVALLVSRTPDEFASALGRFPADDVVQHGSMVNIVNQYAELSGKDMPAVFWDLTRVEAAGVGRAGSGSLLQGGAGTPTGQFRKLWERFTSDPASLADEDVAMLIDRVGRVASATDFAADDLTVGPVGRIDRLQLDEDGNVTVSVAYPQHWNDGAVSDQAVREARLKQLNTRQFAETGARNLEYLYDLGLNYHRRGLLTFGKRTDAGPDWYPTAREDIARAFGLPNEPSDALERATAAVSFLSEAEDWDTNVPKAFNILNDPTVQLSVLNQDFLRWLRDPKLFKTTGESLDYLNMDPSFRALIARPGEAADHVYTHPEVLNRVRLFFNDPKNFPDGKAFKVSEADLRIILRVEGKAETVTDIFRSTQREKQRNFYLNIYDPDLEWPATIDRHAYDIFYGLDTGVADRPVGDSSYDGERNYDVIADTYRAVADKLGIPVHELQAVTWDIWRIIKVERWKNMSSSGDMKMTKLTNGWSRYDPFRLPALDENLKPIGENVAFDVLSGRGIPALPPGVPVVPAKSVPVSVLDMKGVGELGTIRLPDGSVVHSAVPDQFTTMELRGMYPILTDGKNPPIWVAGEARRTSDTAGFGYAERTDRRFRSESYLTAEIGEHPLFDRRESVVFEVGPDGTVPAIDGVEIVPFGLADVAEPNFALDALPQHRVSISDLTDMDGGLLKRTQWATISNVTDESPPPELMEEFLEPLRQELVRRGYDPLFTVGRYGGYEEPSFLVFGIPPEEALEIGEMFGQESVLTPQGFLFGRDRWKAAPGDFDRTEGLYGAGLDAAFPNEGLTTTTPWPTANLRANAPKRKRKPGAPAEPDAPPPRIKSLIDKAIDDPEIMEVDPRYLWANQPNVTRHHTRRYMEDPDSAPATPDAGNQIPIIYETRDGKRVLLSGHHRAMSALLEGRPLRASVVREPVMFPTENKVSLVDDLAGESEGSFTRVNGVEVGWRVESDFDWAGLHPEEGRGIYDAGELTYGDLPAVDPAGLLSVGHRTARKYRAIVPEGSDRDVIRVAEELEMGGAKNPAVYANRHDVDGDWDVVYESVWRDDHSTVAVRSNTGDISHGHSGPVLVRNGSKSAYSDSFDGPWVPDVPTRPGGRLSYGHVEVVAPAGDIVRPGQTVFDLTNRAEKKYTGLAFLPDGRITTYMGTPPAEALAFARKSRNKVTVEALTDDMVPAMKLRTDLEDLGFEPQVVASDGRAVEHVGPTEYEHDNFEYFKDGSMAPRAPRDRPLPEFFDRFGFDFDIGFRVGNRVDEIAPAEVQALVDLTQRFFDEGFGEAFKRWRPSKIKVRKLEDAFGEMSWTPGGAVFLDRDLVSSPLAQQHLVESVAEGHLARGATPGLPMILAHEYGHVMHGAVKLSQNFRDSATTIDLQVIKLAEAAGPGKWRANVKSLISENASTGVDELIAEAFSEYFSGTPSQLSVQIVDLVRKEIRGVQKYRRIRDLARRRRRTG
jgi:hypothetical protein